MRHCSAQIAGIACVFMLVGCGGQVAVNVDTPPGTGTPAVQEPAGPATEAEKPEVTVVEQEGDTGTPGDASADTEEEAAADTPEPVTPSVSTVEDDTESAPSKSESPAVAWEGISDENEPNNSPAQANALALGKPFRIAIQQKGDNDWFKVEVSEQGYLNVMVKGVPKGIKPQVRFCTYDEWDDKAGVVRNWRYLPDACAGQEGVYYLCMIDDYNDKASPESFTAVVNFIDEMDVGERNDSPKTAKPFKPGTAKKIAVFPVGDNDWYNVKVDEQGYIRVITRGAGDGVKPQVRYCTFDEWKDEITVHRNWKYLPDGFAVTQGEYLINIIDDYNDKGSPELFDIRLDFLPEFDKAEPNNSPTEATEVSSGQTLSPAIYPVGDTDWFSMSVPAQGYVRVSGRGFPEDIKPQVRYGIYDEWKEEITVLRNWSYLPDACAVQKGVIHVQLIDDYEDHASTDNFVMKLDFVPEFDETEPNNSFDEAKMIGPNTAVDMAIFPAGDRDFHSIKATGPGRIQVDGRNPEGLKLQVALMKSEDKRISDWLYLPAEIEIPEAGDYCLLVIDDYNDHASEDLVSLSVKGDVLESPAPAAATGAQEGEVSENVEGTSEAAPQEQDDVVECPKCKGAGKIKRPRPCAKCHGSGFVHVECHACDGAGKRQIGNRTIPCRLCNGSGKRRVRCPECRGRRRVMTERACPFCKGTGQVPKP